MAEELESNWVKLEPGVQVRLHFIDHKAMVRTVTDPIFGVPRAVNGLVFRVDKLNGNAVDKNFSLLSDKARGDMAGYLEGRRYLAYEFVWVKDAAGTVAPRLVEVRPI